MNVINNSNGPEKISAPGRKDGSKGPRKAPRRGRAASRPAHSTGSGQPIPDQYSLTRQRVTRQRIVSNQRSISEAQRLLGGLEDLRVNLDRNPDLSAYVARITYDQKPVLKPYQEKLAAILAGRDKAALDHLIEEVRDRISSLAVALSRFQTQEQNRRAVSVVSPEESLREIVAGIRKQGAIGQVKRENILNLLT